LTKRGILSLKLPLKLSRRWGAAHSKGDEILVKGELCNHKWQDKEGRKRTDNVIRALRIRFLRTKSKSVSDQPIEHEEDIVDEAMNSDTPF